jgi:aldehyde:ferredoxin oxidoreductase
MAIRQNFFCPRNLPTDRIVCGLNNDLKTNHQRKKMKFIHVNMTSGAITEAPVPEQYDMFGGRGLTSIMISDLVPADCDPLGNENLLIFAPGFLTGTPLVNTGRLSIGGKSPLTGGIIGI